MEMFYFGRHKHALRVLSLLFTFHHSDRGNFDGARREHHHRPGAACRERESCLALASGSRNSTPAAGIFEETEFGERGLMS
jgi:hypothetical protein